MSDKRDRHADAGPDNQSADNQCADNQSADTGGRRGEDRRKMQIPFGGGDRRKADRRSGEERRKNQRRSGMERRGSAPSGPPKPTA